MASILSSHADRPFVVMDDGRFRATVAGSGMDHGVVMTIVMHVRAGHTECGRLVDIDTSADIITNDDSRRFTRGEITKEQLKETKRTLGL